MENDWIIFLVFLIMNFMIHSDLTEKIIGACFDVHNELGYGFPEIIYQKGLAYEFDLRGIVYRREVEREIFYKDCKEPIGSRIVDFLVSDLILVEIKATSQIENSHISQLLNYLKVHRIDVGLLVNFGARKLEFKRLVRAKKE